MDLPYEVPVMTLPNATLFPGALLPLYLFEPRYRRMLADTLESHRVFAVALRKPGSTREVPAPVAGLGMIRVAVTRPDGTSYVILQGLARVELCGAIKRRPYRVESVQPLLSKTEPVNDLSPLTQRLRHLVTRRLEQGMPGAKVELLKVWPSDQSSQIDSLAASTLGQFMNFLTEMEDPGQIADLVTCALLPKAEQRQVILEAVEVESRLRQVIHFLDAEVRRKKAS